MKEKSEEADEPEEGKPKKKRIAKAGTRHRRESDEVEIVPVPPPDPTSIGALTTQTYDILAGGPRSLIAAEHRAAQLAEKFGEEFQQQWCLTTKWLGQLAKTNRARARYALHWRPRYLAMLALTRSNIIASRAAKISKNTALAHRKADPDFDAQCCAAEDYAVQLLHDVTFRDALEGTCKPIYWQGIMVGHERQFDNRLRVEMLRAWMPDRFKTPGSKAPLVSGDGNNILIVDAATQEKLIAMRREALEDMKAAHDLKAANATPVN